MSRPKFRSEQIGTRSQVREFKHPLNGPLHSHRQTSAEVVAKATADEYNAAELRVFKEKWAKLPPGKAAWPSITRKEVLAELAKTGGRRRTRRHRKHRSTRRR
jgi:hypothetical protein